MKELLKYLEALKECATKEQGELPEVFSTPEENSVFCYTEGYIDAIESVRAFIEITKGENANENM